MGGAGRARPSAGQPEIIAKPLLPQTCSWARLIESKAVAAVAQWIEYWPPKPRVVGSIPASRTKNNGTTINTRVPSESGLPEDCTVPQACTTWAKIRKCKK